MTMTHCDYDCDYVRDYDSVYEYESDYYCTVTYEYECVWPVPISVPVPVMEPVSLHMPGTKKVDMTYDHDLWPWFVIMPWVNTSWSYQVTKPCYNALLLELYL